MHPKAPLFPKGMGELSPEATEGERRSRYAASGATTVPTNSTVPSQLSTA